MERASDFAPSLEPGRGSAIMIHRMHRAPGRIARPDRMAEEAVGMKTQMQPVEPRPADDPFAEGAEQFWHDNGYLPPQDDQSWREQDAHRIVTAGQAVSSDEPASAEPAGHEPAAPTEVSGFGRVETFFALFTVTAIAIFIVALTAPNILSASFWRAEGPANPRAAPASPPERLAAIPAPVLEGVPEPRSPPPRTARPDLKETPGVKAEAPRSAAPETVSAPPARELAPRPAPRAQAREKTRDRASGFYARVPQPDGTLGYRYFPSDPRLDPKPAVPALSPGGTGGFYAMVAGPGGTLEYKYFPPKLTR